MLAALHVETALTVRDVANAYIADKRVDLNAGLICPKHFERLTRYLNAFCDFCGSTPISECRRHDLRKWLRENPRWKSGYTLEDACGAVIACFRWAADEWEDVRFPQFKRPSDLIPGKPVRRPLLDHEFYAIIRQSRKGHHHRISRLMFRAALLFLWRTGARTSEMREAHFADIDWCQGAERIVLAKHKTVRKSGAVRVIPLDMLTVHLLKLLYRFRRFGQQRIFVNGRGKPWVCQRFAHLFRRIADECGIPKGVSPYSTRTGFACRGRQAGVSSDDVADVLGNDPETVRRHYDAWQRTQAGHLLNVLTAANKKSRT